MTVRVFDRATGEYREERQYGAAGLRFLYRTRLGRGLLSRTALRPWFSTVNALTRRTPWSAGGIPRFAAAYGIDLGELATTQQFNIPGDPRIEILVVGSGIQHRGLLIV